MFLYLQIVFCNKKILSVNIKTNAAKQLLSSKNSHLQLNNCPVRLSADRLEMPAVIAYYAKQKVKKEIKKLIRQSKIHSIMCRQKENFLFAIRGQLISFSLDSSDLLFFNSKENYCGKR